MKIKKLSPNAVIPTRGTKYAAGYDLYADLSSLSYVDQQGLISPGHMKKIPTGIAMEIPLGYFGAIFPRSGLATKNGLRLANCVAVIDTDYRGEIIVPLYNDSQETQKINQGDRIAQIVFIPYGDFSLEEVEELSKTTRGDRGFGSTGTGL